MKTFIPLTEIHPNPERIARSLRDAPDYQAHWRFLVSEQHLIRIQQAPDREAALDAIVAEEKDRFVRWFVLFQSGRDTPLAPSFDYALRCHRSANGKRVGENIASMVVAGRTSAQIAEENASHRYHIVVFEKLFFDVRRYLLNRFWIALVCYFPNDLSSLDKSASRRLISAFERGWPGLAATFSKFQLKPVCGDKKAFEKAFARLLLGCTNRSGDYVSTLEMEGVNPSLEEMKFLLQLDLPKRGIAPGLAELDYVTPRSPTQEKQYREAAKLVGKYSRAQLAQGEDILGGGGEEDGRNGAREGLRFVLKKGPKRRNEAVLEKRLTSDGVNVQAR